MNRLLLREMNVVLVRVYDWICWDVRRLLNVGNVDYITFCLIGMRYCIWSEINLDHCIVSNCIIKLLNVIFRSLIIELISFETKLLLKQGFCWSIIVINVNVGIIWVT